MLQRIATRALVALALLAVSAVTASAGLPFTFSATEGVATDMTGATSFGFSLGADDQSSAVTNIGFTFNFNGTDYTQFSVNTNGALGLGGSTVTSSFVNSSFPNATYPFVAAWWEDLQVSTTSGAGIRYKVSGSSPNRVLTVEWDEMMWLRDSDILYTFQTRLYETSNRIEYVYIAMPTSQSTSGTIGLAASSTQYLSVTPGATATVTGTSANNGINLSSSSVSLGAGTMFAFNPCGTGIPYAFTPAAGSGTDMSSSTSFGFSLGDDDLSSSVVNIGFTFNFNGTDYTQFSVNTNGAIGLGSSSVTSSFTNSSFPNATYPFIAAWWEDLQVSWSAGAGIRYEVSGTSPNRVLTVEWDEMMWARNPSIIYTFQTRLYETSNRIEFVYLSMPTSQTTSGTIGIAASSSSYLSVTPSAIATASGTSANNSINLASASTALGSGTMFVFDPSFPDITSEPTSLTVCTSEDAVFSVSATGVDLGYQWRFDGNDIAGATSSTLTISDATTADAGSYDCVITGACETVTSAAATLTVHAPPTIAVALDPTLLWPPNHTMHTITADVDVTGNCTPLTIELVSLVSNEPDDANGNGDGNTIDDVQNFLTGSEDYSFDVRAERAAQGTGRVYTATYRVTDAAGNTAEASATVTVPRSQGGAKPVISMETIGMTLEQNTPNPFSGRTEIRFRLAEQGEVALKVYTTDGREVATLAQGIFASGAHTTTWSGTDDAGRQLPAGVYFCRLIGFGVAQQQQMVLAR